MEISLSTLLRQGAGATAPCTGDFLWIQSGRVHKACALGAMGVAAHLEVPDEGCPAGSPEARSRARSFSKRSVFMTFIDRADFPPEAGCPQLKGDASKVPLRTVVMTLNDDSALSRRAIAEWLASIEEKYDLTVEVGPPAQAGSPEQAEASSPAEEVVAP